MQGRRRPLWQIGIFLALGVALMLVFAALGVWQLERRAWKHDLIARVEARIHAAPAPLPALDGTAPSELEYRRVTVTGTFDHARETMVQAVTELGGGSWVLTPLTTAEGRTILINRGFVPPEMRDQRNRPGTTINGPVAITGLARLSEPGGAFLRNNDPETDRWYSRDVPAIAAARGLDRVTAFFIDAEAGPDPDAFPVGGLTVVQFRDTHLVYALTWFVLAGMVAAANILLIRMEWQARLPRSGPPQPPEADRDRNSSV